MNAQFSFIKWLMLANYLNGICCLAIDVAICFLTVHCPTPMNGMVHCPNGTTTGVFEDTCTFSCNADYQLQGSNNGTCLANGNWRGGLPSCIPLNNCSQDNLPVPANATVLQLPSCGQSQCTVSCNEGFTGDDVTYLCNVTSDPTMVDWVPIGGVDVMCERGLL